jgi:SIR2-like domain
MYDARLIRKINEGRCFALIGSGPSNEMGYPSWSKLAEDVFAAVRAAGKMSDEPSYKKFLDTGKYPELFRLAEMDLGSRDTLISIVKKLLVRPVGRTSSGYTYSVLCNWPFACYLTTNYDDEIFEHLKKIGVFYHTIQNSRDDLGTIRHNASSLIVKLHSDLDHPKEVVLTSDDYERLTVGGEGASFRQRLRSIFEMFDVCIIGHSLKDPHIQFILQTAKQYASPEHPVFMITSDVTRAEERELFDHSNIIALPYENPDGKHERLRRLLTVLNKFITPRRERILPVAATYSSGELEAAQSIMIYRRITALSAERCSIVDYLGPLVIQTFRSNDEGEKLSEAELKKRQPLTSAISTEKVASTLSSVLDEMYNIGLLSRDQNKYSLTTSGRARGQQVSEQKKTEEAQAYGQFAIALRSNHESLSPTEEAELIGLFKSSLVSVFKARGLAIANSIFAGQSADSGSLSDIFQTISVAAGTIKNTELAFAFVEAAQIFILEPSEIQKQYLASLSQGFFLYHLFGLDPNCAKMRRDIFEHTIWWCDSSVLIPFLAQGCFNHDYASDLFTRLQKINALTLTTGRLIQEVWEHLEWAARQVEKGPTDPSAFMAASLQMGSYKQNLFVDGYIRLAAEGKVGTFKDYLAIVSPAGFNKEALVRSLQSKGFQIFNVNEMAGYETSNWGDIEELAGQIKEIRSKFSSFRSELQVEAEAEILHMIRGLKDQRYKCPIEKMDLERSYFVSQSRVLDQVPPDKPVSWTPEALYRYLLALPGETINSDLLQQCMMQEYYSAGVVFVDKPRYQKFFGPTINAAKTKFAEEKERYLAEAATAPGEVDKAFENTPDLEKPFFVQQMGFRMAELARNKAQAADKRTVEAERQLQALRAEKDSGWKKKQKARERQEDAEGRHSKDPKYLRKRRKQAKRRSRKAKR